MSPTAKMGLISCFVKISAIILSLTPSLSAHTLPTESLLPRVVVPEVLTGLTYSFKYQNEQGEPFSEKDAAAIKVYHYKHDHQPNNSAKTSHLQKRSHLIDHSSCHSTADDWIYSKCLPDISHRAWQSDCFRGPVPGPFGSYLVDGTCLDSEICINGRSYDETAHCVSLEDFVRLSLTRTNGKDQTFHHSVQALPVNSQVTLRATDSTSNTDIRITHLEMSAQRCVKAIGNIEQCATIQYAACDYCNTDVLRLTQAGANRITFLARFYRPGVNLYLGVVPSL